jgi:excisionase family DNA binding protein
MAGPPFKTVYTTGEVARLCNVSQQTVIRNFDNGRLEGFRVPGSRFRRIPHEALVRWMRENEIPLDVIDDGRRKVLVVDDDEAIVEMLTEMLERDGRFTVRTARSGYEAGLLTEQFRPDLILLDFKLPDVNGTTVCRTIRRNPVYRHIRIICVSGVADPDEIRELHEAGIDEFMRKPFNIRDLKELMARLLYIE